MRNKISRFFLCLILLGIPINLWSNRYYDNDWTNGEWLISYAGGFTRRGLPGSIIHEVATRIGVNPIHVIWIASLCSYAALGLLLTRLCKDRIRSTVLLSPLVLLGPLIGNYLIRKDAFALALYGLSLAAIQPAISRKQYYIPSLAAANILSSIAILSHEAYGFWALPSILLVVSTVEPDQGQSTGKSIAKAIAALAPTIVIFFICLAYKGSPEQALTIHQSWQQLSHLLPSLGNLTDQNPKGAIEAIGWSTEHGLSLTYSTLNDIDSLIWIPAAWMLTIFIAMNVFISSGDPSSTDHRRIIVCLQFLAVSPLFILGWDFGRWIFIWITSASLLYGFLSRSPETEAAILNLPMVSISLTRLMTPSLRLRGNLDYALLILGIPPCCWTVLGFLLSTPLGNSLNVARKIALIASANR